MISYYIIWCDLIWYDMILYEPSWYDMIWYDLILFIELLEQITGKWIHPTTSFLILKVPSLHIGLAFPRSCLCTRSLSSPEWFPNVVEIIAKIPHWWFFKVICVYQVCLLRCWMNLFFLIELPKFLEEMHFVSRNQSFRFIMVLRDSGTLGPWVVTVSLHPKMGWFPLLLNLLTPSKMNMLHIIPLEVKRFRSIFNLSFHGSHGWFRWTSAIYHLPGVKTSVLPCDVSFWGILLRNPSSPWPRDGWVLCLLEKLVRRVPLHHILSTAMQEIFFKKGSPKS